MCAQAFGGYKPWIGDLEGIDLIFERDDRVFAVEIKSGPHWGNSSQIKKMRSNFAAARNTLVGQFPGREIICVNGCSYGKESKPLKGKGTDEKYLKLCGQEFWSLISGNDQLYTQIIEPLGHQAQERNQAFDGEYAKTINKLTLEFGRRYCAADGSIDWEQLVRSVSESPRSPSPHAPA